MRFSISTLKTFTLAILEKAGYSGEDAAYFADSLLFANERGVDSHGVTRLRTYAKRIASGVVDSHAHVKVTNDSDTFLAVDGANAMGVIICRETLDLCIERARRFGSCFAAVSHGNHFGTGAFHALYGAERSMITVALSNTSPCVAPTGARTAFLGTNPLAIAFPSRKYGALVLDMATCPVAKGKVILAEKEGKKIPLGWAVGPDGSPTDDPKAALQGAMLPFGGAKGYGISLVIEVLCSVLSGAPISKDTRSFWNDFERPQDLGFFLGVMDIAALLPLELFLDRVDEVFDRIKALPKAPGVEEIYLPGEIEALHTWQTQTAGVELGEGVYQDLLKLAEEYGVSPSLLNGGRKEESPCRT